MIDIKNLTFGYSRATALFDDLNLELPGGSIYGLLGKNGAGKSSLLKIIQGLLFPTAGRVEVMAHLPIQRDPDFLSDCFLIPEDLHIPRMQIHTFIRLYAPFYPRFDGALFEHLLDEFELGRTAHLHRLSLGQKKKAMLAFGLACNSRVLLLDEPTNGLDIPSKRQFRSVLARHISDERLFILSTHQIRDLQSLIDTLIILDRGKIIFQATLAEVMERLQFTVSYQEPQDPLVLYYERVPGGYYCIRHQGVEESLEVDVEILFNAVIGEPGIFSKLFKTVNYVR
jgi:ABC-2 type transport system ATP-binding protein